MTDVNRTKNLEKRELSLEDMVKGIGRKATNEELFEYLSKSDDDSIEIDLAFSKYEY